MSIKCPAVYKIFTIQWKFKVLHKKNDYSYSNFKLITKFFAAVFFTQQPFSHTLFYLNYYKIQGNQPIITRPENLKIWRFQSWIKSFVFKISSFVGHSVYHPTFKRIIILDMTLSINFTKNDCSWIIKV